MTSEKSIPAGILKFVGLMVIIVFFSLLLMRPFFSKLSDHPIHVDEGAWISASLYKWQLIFVNNEIFSKKWNHKVFYNLPPVASYIIGFSVWRKGYGSIIKPFKHIKFSDIERDKMIQISRIPMAAMGGLSALVMFWIYILLKEKLAAVIGSILLSLNPLMIRSCKRAMSESPMTFFMVLSSFFCNPVDNKDESEQKISIISVFYPDRNYRCSGNKCKITGWIDSSSNTFNRFD